VGQRTTAQVAATSLAVLDELLDSDGASSPERHLLRWSLEVMADLNRGPLAGASVPQFALTDLVTFIDDRNLREFLLSRRPQSTTISSTDSEASAALTFQRPLAARLSNALGPATPAARIFGPGARPLSVRELAWKGSHTLVRLPHDDAAARAVISAVNADVRATTPARRTLLVIPETTRTVARGEFEHSTSNVSVIAEYDLRPGEATSGDDQRVRVVCASDHDAPVSRVEVTDHCGGRALFRAGEPLHLSADQATRTAAATIVEEIEQRSWALLTTSQEQVTASARDHLTRICAALR
jgi:hypothetical protein